MHIQCRLPRYVQLIRRHDPRAHRGGAVHGFLGQQVQASNLFTGVARTDVIAHRVPQQTIAGVRLCEQWPTDHGHQLHFVIKLTGQWRKLDLVLCTDQRRFRLDVSQWMRWHIAAQALEMTEVIEPHAKHPATRLQRREQPCRGQGHPLVVQIKYIRHQPRT
ncbi:hypothetical protein D9M71_647020 [compost metagenome]